MLPDNLQDYEGFAINNYSGYYFLWFEDMGYTIAVESLNSNKAIACYDCPIDSEMFEMEIAPKTTLQDIEKWFEGIQGIIDKKEAEYNNR